MAYEKNIEENIEEYPVGIGSSLAEVRQAVLEAMEHENDPDY